LFLFCNFTDNKSTKVASDDLIDLDESVSTSNESIIESSNGKIILETFPNKLKASRDIISDDVDSLAGSGSGADDETTNVTETTKFTVLTISGQALFKTFCQKSELF